MKRIREQREEDEWEQSIETTGKRKWAWDGNDRDETNEEKDELVIEITKSKKSEKEVE